MKSVHTYIRTFINQWHAFKLCQSHELCKQVVLNLLLHYLQNQLEHRWGAKACIFDYMYRNNTFYSSRHSAFLYSVCQWK